MSFTLLRYQIDEQNLARYTGYGYSLSAKEVCLSVVTGLTAIPFAIRHFRTANLQTSMKINEFAWTHYIIGVIQCFPIIGAIAALIEVWVARHFFSKNWDLQFLNEKEHLLFDHICPYAPDKFPAKAKPVKQENEPRNEPSNIRIARKFIAKCKEAVYRRKTGHFLPKKIRTEVNQLLSDPYVTAPAAGDGCTPVFFPKDIPSVVLKRSWEKSYKRMCKMARVRAEAHIGPDHPLVIPKVLLYRKYHSDQLLIEQRLPIHTNIFEQIKLYTQYSKEFTLAIRSFASLVIKFGIEDMIGPPCAGSLSEPRTDNFPLFIDENGAFKLGLIDLEFIKKFEDDDKERKKEKKDKLYQDRLNALVYMYPNHLEEILDEARKLGAKERELDARKDKLLQEQEKGLNLIQTYYTDLQNYVQARGNPKNPHLTISSELYSQIISEILKEYSLEQCYKDTLAAAIDEIIAFVNELEARKSVFGEQVIACSYNDIQQKLPYLEKPEALMAHREFDRRFDITIFFEKLQEKGVIYSYHVDRDFKKCIVVC